MHDDYTQQQMESTLQKVFGIAASTNNPYSSASTNVTDDPDFRPPPQKRASRVPQHQLGADESGYQVRHAEFPSTSIADFFNLNGPQNPVGSTNRLSFSSADLNTFVPQQTTSTNSQTWARLLAAGNTNCSPLSLLDEAFVEIFADKVANKVVNVLSPQIHQIRTAIIGLARLVEINQAVLVDKRVQSPPTPPQQTQELQLINAVSASSAITSNKKRNPSPSKVDQPTGINVSISDSDIITTKQGGREKNGPAATKNDRKTGDGKPNPKRTVKEVPDVYRIIKLDDLAVHFNMTEKLCLLCRETFTESHLHSVKRHMYRKHRGELDVVLQRKTSDPLTILLGEKPTIPANSQLSVPHSNDFMIKTDYDTQDQNELIDVVDVGNNDQNKFQPGVPTLIDSSQRQ